MYLYNITFNIDEKIHQNWLQWVQEKHIPEVLEKATFKSAKLIQVMLEEEMGGITYSVQYQVESKQLLDSFLNDSTYNLFAEMTRLFPNQFVSFSTELQVINEFHLK